MKKIAIVFAIGLAAICCVLINTSCGEKVKQGQLSALISVSVSPNGKSLAFESYGQERVQGIYVAALNDALAPHKAMSMMLLVSKGRNFNWKSDNKSFLFDQPPINNESDDKGSSIYIGALHNPKYRFLTKGWMGCCSPDGKRVAYVRDRGLHIIDIESGTVKTIVEGDSKYAMDVSDPAWSPDGHSIVYARANGGLWLISLKGGKPRSITPVSTQHSDMEPVFFT